MSVKTLAEQVLRGNRQGDREETKGFLTPEIGKPQATSQETLPFGITLAELEAEYGSDPDWQKIKNSQLWLFALAETVHKNKQASSKIDVFRLKE